MEMTDELLKRLDYLPPQAILEHLNYDDYENDGGKPIPNLETFLDLTQPLGNIKKAGSNTLYGINHRGLKPAVPENRDVYGITFFTRPQLNLTSINLRRNRKFFPLLNTDSKSIHRYVRCMLDPRLGQILNWDWENIDKTVANAITGNPQKDAELLTAYSKQNIIKSDLVDSDLAFIPILTNNLLSLSGWPDIAMSSYTSEQGHKREQWIMMDSAYEYLEAFNLTAVFRNTRDEPILMLFQYWLLYMAQVFEGMIMPYLDMLANNEMDYNTRIYRFVLDESKRFVKKTAACGAAFPTSVPTGKMFDYSDEEVYNRSSKEVDITFQCVGADYNDFITIHEFNWTSAMFHAGMRNICRSVEPRRCGMVKIPRGLLPMLNNRGYPYIDPHTLELQWYINEDSKDLNKIFRHLKRSILRPNIFGSLSK